MWFLSLCKRHSDPLSPMFSIPCQEGWKNTHFPLFSCERPILTRCRPSRYCSRDLRTSQDLPPHYFKSPRILKVGVLKQYGAQTREIFSSGYDDWSQKNYFCSSVMIHCFSKVDPSSVSGALLRLPDAVLKVSGDTKEAFWSRRVTEIPYMEGSVRLRDAEVVFYL